MSAAQAETIEEADRQITAHMDPGTTQAEMSAAQAETIDDADPDMTIYTYPGTTQAEMSAAQPETIDDADPDMTIHTYPTYNIMACYIPIFLCIFGRLFKAILRVTVC